MKIIFLLKTWVPVSLSSLLAIMFFESVRSTETSAQVAQLWKAGFGWVFFLSYGIGKFLKLCKRRRLWNRRIISLLAAIPASTDDHPFPFGLGSDRSLRRYSPWRFPSLVISSCSFAPSSSSLPPGASCSPTWLLMVISAGTQPPWGQSPSAEAGREALVYSQSWIKILADGFSLRCQQVWLGSARPDTVAKWILRPYICFLAAFV